MSELEEMVEELEQESQRHTEAQAETDRRVRELEALVRESMELGQVVWL